MRKKILILTVLLSVGVLTGLVWLINFIPHMYNLNKSPSVAGSYYTIQKITTCKNVQESYPYEPITETNSFTPYDEYCYVWMQLTYI